MIFGECSTTGSPVNRSEAHPGFDRSRSKNRTVQIIAPAARGNRSSRGIARRSSATIATHWLADFGTQPDRWEVRAGNLRERLTPTRVRRHDATALRT